MRLLDARDVKRSSVDLVRFSWDDEENDQAADDDGEETDHKVAQARLNRNAVTTPVTIWIGVLPDTLSADAVYHSSSNILDLLAHHKDRTDEPVRYVIKRGLTTHTTVGCLTGFESHVRRYFALGIGKRDSVEAAILPYDTDHRSFSIPGDSGSVIVDKSLYYHISPSLVFQIKFLSLHIASCSPSWSPLYQCARCTIQPEYNCNGQPFAMLESSRRTGSRLTE